MVFFFFRKGASGSSGSAFSGGDDALAVQPGTGRGGVRVRVAEKRIDLFGRILAMWNLKKWLRTAALFGVQLIRLIAANQTLTASAFRLQKSLSGTTFYRNLAKRAVIGIRINCDARGALTARSVVRPVAERMSGTGFQQLQPPVFQRDQIAGTFRNLRGHDAVVEREAGVVFGNGDRFFRAQQGWEEQTIAPKMANSKNKGRKPAPDIGS